MFFLRGLVLFSLLALGAPGQTELIGRLTDRVACATDPAQGYALYVPSNYHPQRLWPVIFCFDASARGKMPVERLQAAAEKYGYIVAGSLNSRNGPWPANAAAMQAMVGDVNQRFSLDSHRLYATGVSGGARVATQVALNGLVQGVIACSAGFPAPGDLPSQIPFAYFVTAGIEDINFGEVRRLEPLLDARHAAHRTVIFAGGHEWASSELMTEAVEWLELQAMRTGTRPKNARFLSAQFNRRLATVPNGPTIERWRELKSLTADFAGLAEADALADETKALGDSREIRAALAREAEDARRESELVQRLADEARRSLARKTEFVRKVVQTADDPNHTPTRQLTRRAALSFCFIARETARGLLVEGKAPLAVELLETAALLQPRNSRIAYDLAKACALTGDKAHALAALTRAAANGLSDAARLEAEAAFAKLRVEPEFQAALKVVRTNPTEPPRPLRWES